MNGLFEQLGHVRRGRLLLSLSKPQREAMRRRNMEQQSWHFSHKYGVVDFAEKKVWLTDGHVRDVAWSS